VDLPRRPGPGRLGDFGCGSGGGPYYAGENRMVPGRAETRTLGKGNWSLGVAKAGDTSPGTKKTLELLVQRERDPTVQLAEIGVHTHPSGMLPA
jgi:hypothetical protein